MFKRVLVANRGEIAVRVLRACRELGIHSVAVYSEADARSQHVALADEAHLLGPAPASDSYLNIARIIEVATVTGVDAIHPGYGFLAENAHFARAVADAGMTFVGPSPEAIESMGDKLSARRVAADAGVAVVPGTSSPVASAEEALEFGERHGYPLAIKAMFGGGGRGMKVVREPTQLGEALEAATREATASFGRGECYLERYLEDPRHIEVQILADRDGTVVHLGDRDCSLQRRHQKLVEEAPAPSLHPQVRRSLAEAAVRIAREMNYQNAGTCEFLLDADGQTFYFLEMNTRLQVEHPVTELVTGVDLVHEQLRIASGDGMLIRQDEVRLDGHAMEARINAEDPAHGFVPTPGLVARLDPPLGPWVRFDTGISSGSEVSPHYDSMIGKLVVWGRDRDTARSRLAGALAELTIEGIPSTVPFHRYAVAHPDFSGARHTTMSVEHEWDLTELPAADLEAEPQEQATSTSPAATTQTSRDVALTVGGQPLYVTVYGTKRPGDRAASTSRRQREARADAAARDDGPELTASMQGTVVKVVTEDGASVAAGELVCIIEAMKMENHITAHRSGTVSVKCAPGDHVERGAVLATITD